MIGILHPGAADATTAIVIVVGGPQYRVGSHRQFVSMARQMASAGIPVLRFDWRGMGDAEGRPRTFETAGEDIRAAVDCLIAAVPGISRIVLLGLCDGASENLIYAHKDDRVRGLILLNPWVRTAQGEARSYLRYYYLQRLLQRSLWRKVISGKFSITRSWREFRMTQRLARCANDNSDNNAPPDAFVSQMLSGLAAFKWPILILLSGRDLTAREFENLCEEDDRWRSAIKMSDVTMNKVLQADHTFSEAIYLRTAGEKCLQWLCS